MPLRSGGLDTLNLVTGITVVNTDTLLAFAPNLFEGRKMVTMYDPRLGCLVDKQQIRFGKRTLMGTGQPRLEDTQDNRRLFAKEYTKWAYELLDRQRQKLILYYKNVPRISLQQVENEFRQRAGGIVSLDQLDSKDKRRVTELSKLEAYLGDDFMHKLGKPRRQPKLEKKRRSGWEPQHKRKYKRERW